MSGHAHGYPLPEGATFFDGHAVDANGNPLVVSEGCPNCREGAGWVAAALSFLVERPCSRRCELQLEYARSLRDESATAETSTKGGRKAGEPDASQGLRVPAPASAERSHAVAPKAAP